MKKVVSIAVLTPRSKSMLWMRRADNQKWTLPGGHIEEGESPVDGALRELWEETGIRASKKDLKALGYDNVDDKYRVYAFTYTPDSIPVPTSENDPDGESDGEFLWFKDGELPEKQHVPEGKNVTLNLLKEKPVAKSENLDKMAIKDLPPGERVEPEEQMQTWGDTFDYSHLIPSKWKGKLALHVHQGNEMSLARLYDLEDPDHNHVGEVKAYHGAQLPWEDRAIEPHSELQENYQGHGLGQAMYEAMYAHAYHHMGIREVVGSFHTDAAGRVHEKLAAKHGLGYKKQRPRPTVDGNDAVRKPYRYTLKTELAKTEPDEQAKAEFLAYGRRAFLRVFEKVKPMFGPNELESFPELNQPDSMSPAVRGVLMDLVKQKLAKMPDGKEKSTNSADLAAALGAMNVERPPRPDNDNNGYFIGWYARPEDVSQYLKVGGSATKALVGGTFGNHKAMEALYGSPVGRSAFKDYISTHYLGRKTTIPKSIVHDMVTGPDSKDYLPLWKQSNAAKLLDSWMDDADPDQIVRFAAALKPTGESVADSLPVDVFQHPKVPVELANEVVLTNPWQSFGKLHPDLSSDALTAISQHALANFDETTKTALATHENTPWEVINRIVSTGSGNSAKLAAMHPSIPIERLKQLAKNNPFALYNPNMPTSELKKLAGAQQSPETRKTALSALAMHDPDSFHAAHPQPEASMTRLAVPDISTEKIRQLRDRVDSLGGVTHVKNLGNLPPSIKPFLDNKGNLSSKALQGMIDSVDSTSYWAGDPGYLWFGAQRHDPGFSQKMFHLNYTNDHVQKMKDAGVWGTFMKIQPHLGHPKYDLDDEDGIYSLSGHPLSPNGIGWVRYSVDGDAPDEIKNGGIHIDEVQSDLGGARLVDEFRSHGIQVRQDHLDTIKKILWGNHKTAQDLIAGAFMHHLRQNPELHDMPVHWPTYELKEKVAEPPKDTYNRLPKELGFKEGGSYGDLGLVQTNDEYKGLPTYTSKVTKTEPCLVNYWLLDHFYVSVDLSLGTENGY